MSYTAHQCIFRPASYRRGDPLDMLLGADDVAPGLAEIIDRRFARGERHTHPKAGGCPTCAGEAADAVLRFVEAHTRVMASDALDADVVERARHTLKSMPYIGSAPGGLRLTGDLAVHPDFPTVEDLLADLATISGLVAMLKEREDARESELHQYRKWADAVRHLAKDATERLDAFDSDGGDDDAD